MRELIDGAAGLRADDDNLASHDPELSERDRTQLEHAARQAGEA